MTDRNSNKESKLRIIAAVVSIRSKVGRDDLGKIPSRPAGSVPALIQNVVIDVSTSRNTSDW
jgi:hypothetical protein